MKGYRFYEELENKNRKDEKSDGNVFALFLDPDTNRPLTYWNGKEYMYEGMGAVFFHSNSAVCITGASPEYLRENCRRISEEKAREIHPRLFQRLDD